MPSPTAENYLKALLALSRESLTVGVTELASSLDVSKPAANSMVKTLHGQGLLKYQRYKPLRLTEDGRRAAALIVRKHRLTEMYLVEAMGFGWEEVHEIAEQVEHIQSPKFFARMDELLGYPSVDPHGSPIPGPDGEIVKLDHRRLAEVPVGDSVVLRAVRSETDELLSFLTRKGIALGTELHVLEQENFDRSLVVSYGENHQERLSSAVVGALWVD